MEKFIFCAVSGQPLSLDINISTKYVYVKKTYTQQEWKSHGNHVFRMSWKLRCASVAWNMSLYHRDKDFRLCKCRTLKSNCTKVWKPSCANGVYNHIVDKDVRLWKCRILKSNFTDVVKVRLCECSVQWYLRKDFMLCRCKPLKSLAESVKRSGWISVVLNNFVSTDFKLYRCSITHVKYCWWTTNSCGLYWCYLEI